jgi:Holliday junction resolvase-like predicted endonuclease
LGRGERRGAARDEYRWTARALLRLDTSRVGKRGEALAAEQLRSQGFRVVAQRVTTPEGELDLVAWRGDELWILEVKSALVSRASLDPHWAPGRRLSASQRARIARAARCCSRSMGVRAAPKLALVEVWIDAEERLAAWRVTEL